MLVGDGGDGFNIQDVAAGVANGLAVEGFGIGFDRPTPGVQIIGARRRQGLENRQGAGRVVRL